MNRLVKKGAGSRLLGAALALTALALALPVQATTSLGGWAGYPAVSSTADIGLDCFSETYGAVEYNNPNGNSSCSGTIHWEIMLPVDAGTYAPVIQVGWPSGSSASSYISCSVTSLYQNGSLYQGGSYSSPSGTSGNANFQPTGSSGYVVTTDGYMFVNCEMSLNAIVYSVNY